MFVYANREVAEKFIDRDGGKNRVAVYYINDAHNDIGCQLSSFMPKDEDVRAVREGTKSVKNVVKMAKKIFNNITDLADFSQSRDMWLWNLVFTTRTLLEVDRHRTTFTVFVKPYDGDTDEEKRLNKLYKDWIETILESFGKCLVTEKYILNFVFSGKGKDIPKVLKKGKNLKAMIRRMNSFEDAQIEQAQKKGKTDKLTHGDDMFKFMNMIFLPEVKAISMYKYADGKNLNLDRLSKKDVRSIADGIASAYCGATVTKMNDTLDKKFKKKSVKALLKGTKNVRNICEEFIEVLERMDDSSAAKVAKKMKKLKKLKNFKNAKQQKKYMKTFRAASESLAKNKYILFAMVEYICRRRNGDDALCKKTLSGCAVILNGNTKNVGFSDAFVKTAKAVKDSYSESVNTHTQKI